MERSRDRDHHQVVDDLHRQDAERVRGERDRHHGRQREARRGAAAGSSASTRTGTPERSTARSSRRSTSRSRSRSPFRRPRRSRSRSGSAASPRPRRRSGPPARSAARGGRDAPWLSGCALHVAHPSIPPGVLSTTSPNELDDRGEADDDDDRPQPRVGQPPPHAGAERSPPAVEPSAISAAGCQATSAMNRKTIAATRLAMPARTARIALTSVQLAAERARQQAEQQDALRRRRSSRRRRRWRRCPTTSSGPPCGRCVRPPGHRPQAVIRGWQHDQDQRDRDQHRDDRLERRRRQQPAAGSRRRPLRSPWPARTAAAAAGCPRARGGRPRPSWRRPGTRPMLLETFATTGG